MCPAADIEVASGEEEQDEARDHPNADWLAGNKSRLIVSITTSMRDIEPRRRDRGMEEDHIIDWMERFGFSNALDT